MIIYSNTSLAFREDVEENRIVDIIENHYIKKIGYKESQGEKAAWRNSLRCMETIVRKSEVPNDCGIMIEYVIPNTSFRVDFIITGEDDNGNKNYILIELKQWEIAEITDIKDLVKTFTGGKKRNVNHPSYQIDSYYRMMAGMNEGIYENHLTGYACAYLHNYNKKTPEPLLDSRYNDLVKAAPVYFSEDYANLQSFMKKIVGKGNGVNILSLIENGKIKPSKKLVDYIDSLFTGNDEFILFGEQNIAYQTILKELNNINIKKTIIVKGGPGTGKSVIAFKLLHAMIDKQLNTKFIAPNEAFREVMIKKLIASNINKARGIRSLFSGSSTLYNLSPNSFDVLIVDEAHRLKDKNAYQYRGENQVKDVIHTSTLNVFFIDDNQRIRKEDIGSVQEIIRIAKQEASEVIEMELKAQFRCAGADGFINWITHTLQIDETANYDGWDKKSFEFQLFDDPNEMFNMIKKKNMDVGTSRMVAGFAWKWSDEENALIPDVTIPEHKFAMPWNSRKERALFALKSESINQIGCVHTVQGLEFDYVGVIIGNDLKYDYETGKIVADYNEYKDYAGKKGLKNDSDELNKLVKNIYRILLSRGLKGCYMYCRNIGLQQYIKSRLGIPVVVQNMIADEETHYHL